MTSIVNVADVERWASAVGGAALTAYGIKQLKDRSPAGAALAAAGGMLIYRGATGHCPVYSAAGISTADGRDDTGAALLDARGVDVEEVVTINASADALYAFWRRLELLPRFMDHLVSVSPFDAHVVIANKDEAARAGAADLAVALDRLGIEVLLDDRKASPGVKFKDAELLGVPWIVVVGRGWADGVVELRNRFSGETREVPVDNAAADIAAALATN